MRLPIKVRYGSSGVVRWTALLCLGLVFFCVGGVATSVSRETPNERMLRELWQQHQTNVTAHALITDMCARIEAQHPRCFFMPVVRSLAAWHYLQDGNIVDARRLLLKLESDVSDDSVKRAGRRMARTWLTRLDREEIRQTLLEFYATNVKYPETLDLLRAQNADRRPLLKDRWNDPWIYEWTQFRFLALKPGQRYRLESRNISNTSDLREALSLAYGAGFDLEPRRITGGGDRAVVEFTYAAAPDEPVLLSPGASYRGQFLVYIGDEILILANADHWGITARP